MAYQSGKRNLFTDALKEKFLAEYTRTGAMYRSAKKIGIAPKTVYEHIERDAFFKQRMEEAYKEFKDDLDAMVRDRVVEGHKEGVWYKGEKVGTETKFDTTLTLAFLRRHMPEYRDKSSLDVNQSGGIVVVSGTLSKEQWLKKAQDARNKRNKES